MTETTAATTATTEERDAEAAGRAARQHRPGPGRPVPTSTYRLQVQPEFTYDDAAALAGYLARLGVTHAYLSPVLQAAPGSMHGYDVVDHSHLSAEAGGREAFDRMVAALREHGLSAVADVVPNHMAVPTPASSNAVLWSVLRDGPYSPYVSWFDVDWSTEDHALLMPVLGSRIGQVLVAGELELDTSGEEPLLRYYDHVFPVRPGTESLPMDRLVEAQWYRLAHWRVADEELNYRRFFDVDTLAAIRVEDEEVFDASHALLLEMLRTGELDGLRIDHPDGLADPRGYLRRLADRTGGAWVVVEKILEGAEQLPDDWPCAGTTGYDALLRVGGLFVDPAGEAPMTALFTQLTGDPADFGPVVERAKREVVAENLYTEVHRLVDLLASICHADVRLRDHTRRALTEVVTELLVAFPRYRAYVVPGEDAPAEAARVLDEAVEGAREHLAPERHETLEVVRDLLLGREAGSAGRTAEDERAELVVRFQQTCGPVMAKGVEDTAFYRWFRLSSLNEVGGAPERFGTSPEEFHAFCAGLVDSWPTTMTTLSTHDTKRAEDARVQLSAVAGTPAAWAEALALWRQAAAPHRSALLDGPTEYLVWQTLVATWEPAGADGDGGPISAERLLAYLEKAVKEAKRETTWTAPDEDYERAVADFATGVLGDEDVLAQVGAFVAATAPAARAAVLGQKLVQLTMPGVPDVYQGTELGERSLVDPDNRRAVDYDRRSTLLERLDGGARPRDLDEEKLLVTSRALRTRRDLAGAFTGPGTGYAPLPTSSGYAVAFARTQDGEARAVTVATRLPDALARYGGWGEHSLTLPEAATGGRWTDVLSGRSYDAGAARLADVLADLPVALLVEEG
ncbi:malto-oligosyltrehalose synthase [Pseudokineococcus basanitobsidens]|uniref:Malto-oligosyltrehalose synthase n=1 Tax=Pseudokineococcus basanitobsidens TaxID=1926649 RepID=A0ABU8RHT6_9ACTN